METINTVRVNQAWLEAQIKENGGAANFARILGLPLDGEPTAEYEGGG